MVAVVLFVVAACGSPEPERGRDTDSQLDESTRFSNAVGDAGFVGDDACFDCHEPEYRGYQDHGMARSYYPLTSENAVEDYSGVMVYHAGSDLHYRALREEGRFYQEEIRRGANGEVIHRLRREMEFVIGSGSAARTYLTEENGRYYELPLTWYTQGERWDFSPGYQHYNVRFDRLIPDRCMTCHNSYPEPVAFVEGKYQHVPDGIGCERCHGPGSIHVDARLSAPEPAGSVDTTIVNPAHLSLERRLDVCQQCHLHTTVSVLREGRTAYDFRPAQSLVDYVSFFAAEEPAGNRIDVISHADRMKQSPCFLETQDTDQPMDCMTCHNPHEGFRDAGPDYFNTTCKGCHDPSALQPRFESEPTRAVHGAESNCFSCHMPKVEAEGTPHASFTDHWIRVVEIVPDPPSEIATTPVRLEPYFEEDKAADVYQGMAYVVYGRQRGDSLAMLTGIGLLESGLRVDSRGAESRGGDPRGDDPRTDNLRDSGFRSGERYGEARFLLGYAHMQLGDLDAAIPYLENAVARDPGIPERLNALAQAYEAVGRRPSKIEQLYRRALDIQPAVAEIRTNYGRFLEAENRLDEAIEQYGLAIEEQPWLETAHYNLGTAYLRSGDLDRAESALREAALLDPDYDDALSNLGLLLAGRGRRSEARVFFERAVEADPSNPVALGNLGAFHLNAGNPTEAIPLLQRSVEADPRYVDGLVNLAIAYFNSNQADLAREYAERALQFAPNNATARQILEAL